MIVRVVMVVAMMGVPGALAAAVGRGLASWQECRAERSRQKRYPWMEPIRHRGAE